MNRKALAVLIATVASPAQAFQTHLPSIRGNDNAGTTFNINRNSATTRSISSLNLSIDEVVFDFIPSIVSLDKLQASLATIATSAGDVTLGIGGPELLVPASIVFGTLYALSFPPEDYIVGNEPYLRGQYDPNLARSYYSKRPLLVLRRALQLFRLSNGFLTNILFDKYILRDSEKNIDKRAVELLELIQNIGPTAIKVGQALSVRSDLIPAAYAGALSELQDNVPPFSSVQAQEVLKSELGAKRYGMLKKIDLDKPVASASIGQVYRGFADVENAEGKKEEVEIAVKVQRPNALAEIALDLFIVREFAPYYQKLTGSATNLQGLANEWGRGFIAELTYIGEAASTKKFNEQMKKKGLNAVTAPTVVDALSTNRILTTEWVRGNRLDRSEEDDVARLCGVALNAYLVMLLETGTLHCDPHPGNLLRTEDGKLCILDFGMTLDTPSSLQFSLLEFIAHLTAENFEDVPYDLVNLGFLKEDKVDLMVKTGSLEPLYYFLRQANQGGGGTKVRERIFEEYREKYPGADDEELQNYMRVEIKEQGEKMAEKASAVTGITMKVEDLQKTNSDAFTIPEWFLYTSRAFLTLEGISLQADSDFSIVRSCFPYVAKRLVGDDSPRAQKALRDLIYGKDDNLNAEKLSEIADGFTQYTTTTKVISSGGGTNDQSSRNNFGSEATLTLARDSADILLAPEGNLVQNLVVEESATAANANIKDTLREILIKNPERIRSSLPLGIGNFLPKGPVKEVERFLNKSEREVQVQTLLAKFTLPEAPSPAELGSMIRTMGGNSSTASTVEGMNAEEIAVLWKAVRENVPVYGPKVMNLGGKFASTVLSQVSNNIEHVIETSKNAESEAGLPEQLVRNSARGISAAARTGSEALKSNVVEQL
uniref:ABC1 atypical kinase-like domain-containing protein n=1 Tax=Chaetoceros debilis TaxID=122233 RepID=A0A7S3PYF1_9STRA